MHRLLITLTLTNQPLVDSDQLCLYTGQPCLDNEKLCLDTNQPILDTGPPWRTMTNAQLLKIKDFVRKQTWTEVNFEYKSGVIDTFRAKS